MHLPFCESLCHFCACNKIITKDHGRATDYLRYLDKELALVAARIGNDRRAVQLHLGGGTPTFFNEDELRQLMAMLPSYFEFTPDAELGVEIDPRTVQSGTLSMLAGLGFNRNSFGVQDFDPAVQKAVNRIQPLEMVEKAVAESREAKFQSINADYRTFKRSKSAPWIQAYKCSILCFIAVGFWNVISAGLLGFTINTPIALYYMQSLNMTSAHGHAALFGVYGMLGIGLLLFCLRGLSDRARWSDKLLAPMFWSLNIGLAMMVFLSLVPAGIYQAWTSTTKGMWFARSPEVVHSAFMETMVWMRVPGDIVFSIGIVFLAWFALRLLKGGKRQPQAAGQPGQIGRTKQA